MERYESKQVKLECDMVDGKKNGECFTYFPSGKLKGISHWKNDTLHGPTTIYYEAGNLQQENNWKNGLVNGECKSYYPNGNLEGTSNYRNGKLHGVSHGYYEDGSLDFIIPFQSGIKIGKEIKYHRNGKVASVLDWVHVIVMNGKLVNSTNTSVKYDEQGNVIHQAHYAEIHLEKDTLSLGEELLVDIVLRYPAYDKMKVLIGNFDEHYLLKDSLHVDTLEGVSFKAKYRLKATKMGINRIRGIIRDYKEEKNKGGGKNTYLEDFYFEKTFYVKPASTSGVPQ